MGAAALGGTGLHQSGSGQDNDRLPIVEKDDIKRRSSNRRHSSGETVHCPTCQGTGRIPRGQESKLVAVIPCNDQRLRPRHTKLYVAVSVGVCLLVSSLVLFFLFPRSVLLSPVAVKSSFVYFTEDGVQINITNVLNITNHNFAVVQAYNLTVQALNFDTVVGTVSIKNVTSVKPLSITTYSFVIPIKLTDPGLSNYCEKASLPVHILYLHLHKKVRGSIPTWGAVCVWALGCVVHHPFGACRPGMSMTVYYLAHYEQLSLETYEYIDCGANSTIPHHVQPPPP